MQNRSVKGGGDHRQWHRQIHKTALRQSSTRTDYYRHVQMILCCDPGPGARLGPVVHRGSRPSGIDCVGGWGAACCERFAAICDEDPHADLRDDLVMSMRSRSAASNVLM